MFKLLLIVTGYHTGSTTTLHSVLASYDSKEAADQAYEVIRHDAGATAGPKVTAKKLYV